MAEYMAVRVDITPGAALPLAGYGARQGDSEGIELNLEANILLVRAEDGGVIALVQMDTLFSSAALEARILAALPPEMRAGCRLVCMASHTHFAPSLDPEKPALGRADEEYMALVADRIGGAIAARMREGEWRQGVWSAGRAETGKLAVSRRSWRMMIEKKPPFVRFGIAKQPNLRAKIASDVHVVRLMEAAAAETGAAGAGKTEPARTDATRIDAGRIDAGRTDAEDAKAGGAEICVLWHFACHPVASPYLRRVSADFAGTVRDFLRGNGAGRGAAAPVLFLPGFMGDTRPYVAGQRVTVKQRIMTPFGKLFGAFTAADYAAWTKELTACVAKAAAAATPLSGAADAAAAYKALDLARVIDGLRRPMEMGVWHIGLGGGLRLVCCGAEAVNAYAAAAGEGRTAEGGLCLAAGYTGPVFGYLPTDRQIREGGYESEEFFMPFNLAGARFKDRIEHEVAAVLRG